MAVSTSYRQGNYSLNSPIPPDPTYASYTNKTRPVSAGNRRSPIPPDPVGTSRSGKLFSEVGLSTYTLHFFDARVYSNRVLSMLRYKYTSIFHVCL